VILMSNGTEDDHVHQVLTIIRDIIDTERVFFESPVWSLPEPIRGRTLLNQSRTTGALLDLARLVYVTSARQSEPRFVVSIPMQDFEDVPIVATEDQITASMSVVENLVETNCSICQDTLTSGSRLRCSHLFHTSCIRNWFQMNSRCPVCRHDIREPHE
jgi:hypothetical protein